MKTYWTMQELAHLWAMTRAGESLAEAAQAIGRFAADCDQALWVMLGREPMTALEILKRRGPVAVAPQGPPAGSTLGRFLAEVLP